MTERELFEKTMKDWGYSGFDFESKFRSGRYQQVGPDLLWFGWQAARRWKYTQDELPETETLIIGKSFNDFYFVYYIDGHFEDEFGNIHEIEKWQYVPEDV